MVKLSFKDKFKKVETFNKRATVVTLTGTLSLPIDIVASLPSNVNAWVFGHDSIHVAWKNAENLELKVSGKSVCSGNDKFNALTGSRIAECRAKIKLYKFMVTLCKKLMSFYHGIIYGVPEGRGEMGTCVISDFHGGLQDALSKYTYLWLRESSYLDRLIEEV